MSRVFTGDEVNLEEMLLARENRVKWQNKLLHKTTNKSLLCATMSIPGPVKTSKILMEVFQEILEKVENSIEAKNIVANLFLKEKTGPEYYLLLEMPGTTLKKIMVEIENTHPLGRLVDLDVLTLKENEVVGLSRKDLGLPLRKCLICNKEAKICGRQRAHSVKEMQEKITEIIAQERRQKLV